MVMQRVAPAADASHELTGTSVFNRDTARATIPETGRVSLARFAWFVVAYHVAAIGWCAYVRATGSAGPARAAIPALILDLIVVFPR